MSSTIDAKVSLLGIIRTTAILAAIATAVLGSRIVLAAIVDESGAVFAIGLDPDLANRLPDGVTISRWDDHVVALQGNGTPLVRWLYGQGARIVLPGKQGGCLSLRGAAPTD